MFYAVVTGSMTPKGVVERPPHRGMWSMRIVHIPITTHVGHAYAHYRVLWVVDRIIVAFLVNSTSTARACSGASFVFPYLVAAACPWPLLQLTCPWTLLQLN